MSNTGRITIVAQGKAPATQASSQTAVETVGSLTTPPPPPVRQDTSIDINNNPPPDNNKSEDETIQIIQRIV